MAKGESLRRVLKETENNVKKWPSWIRVATGLEKPETVANEGTGENTKTEQKRVRELSKAGVRQP